MPSQFSIKPADFSMGVDAAMSGIMKGAQAKEQREMSAEDTAAMEQFSANMETMTPVEVGQYILKNPRVAKQITNALDTTQAMTKEENLQQAYAVARAYITGESGTPQAAPAPPPVAPPSIGFDSAPVAPVGQTPMQPVDQAMMQPQGQTPIEAPSGNPAQAETVKLLTEHAETVMERGGDAKDTIEAIRDTMTGGEKAFKGAMAVIASQDPSGFNNLMKLVGGEEQKSTPSTDIDDFVSDAETVYKAKNPNADEATLAGVRNKARLQIKRAQAPEASLTGEATDTAKLAAAGNMESYKAATTASDNIAKIDDLIEHLGSSEAITGMGAEFFKDMQRVKTLFGSKIAAIKVSDTETLDAMMGSEVFPLIKSLGIGARGMDTPAERKFLRQVMTGQIDLNKATLLRMAKDRRSVAERAITRFNKKVDNGSLNNFFLYSGIPKEKVDTTPKRAAETPDVGAPLEITTEAEYNALAPGAFYLEDGKKYQKPGRQ